MWPVLSDFIQLGLFGAFLFLNIQELLDLKGINEELYYTIIINMWVYLAHILIIVICFLFVNESNLGQWNSFFLIKDILLHCFALYFLFVVFGATAHEKSTPVNDLSEDKFAVIRSLIPPMMFVRVINFIIFFTVLFILGICYITPKYKNKAIKMLGIEEQDDKDLKKPSCGLCFADFDPNEEVAQI